MNKEEFDFLGITKFHEAGYTGKNVTIVSKELIIDGIFEDVICKNPHKHTDAMLKNHSHGTDVMDFIRQVAPGAKKIATNLAGKSNGKTFTSEHLDFIKSEKPDIMTTSSFDNSADDTKVMKAVWQDLYDNGCFLCCAAGNDGEEGCHDIAKDDLWKTVGACEYNKDLKRAFYSAIDDELDFMSFSGLKTTYRGKKINGTSFASPVFAGMIALVQDFFVTNTGKKLTHEKLLEFIKDNCRDLGDKGKDNSYGYGLFILPDPANIDVEKYVGDNMRKKIVLKIDSKLAIVNDKAKILDVAPIIENDRTMVPVRFIAEELGCKVKWDAESKEVIIEK